MSATTVILTLAAIIFANIQIRAEYRGPYLHIYIFKPLVMVCIIIIAILATPISPLYKTLIIVGLLFCIAGDTLLMPPWNKFVAGLIAFLIGHIFYSVAFISQISSFVWWPILPLLLFGIAIYTFLSPSLGSMKGPVLAYVVVILIMAWLGWEYWLQANGSSALLAFAGAIFFVISDSILATNRFRVNFKSGRLLNLATYFIAQWLIAASISVI